MKKKTVKFTVGDSFQCKAFVKKSAQGKMRRLEIVWAPAPPNRPLTEKEDRDYQNGIALAMASSSD